MSYKTYDNAATLCECKQGKPHYKKDCTDTRVEIVEYYAHMKFGRNRVFSLIYETTRPLNDNWGTAQSEPSFFINSESRSREELPASITAEIIAELIATAAIVERRVVSKPARPTVKA